MVQRRKRAVKPERQRRIPAVFAGRKQMLSRAAGWIAAGCLVIWAGIAILPGVFHRERGEPRIPTPPALVEVLNGSGVNGIAAQMTQYIRAHQMDVLTTDNADNSDYAESIIVERDSLGHYAAALSALTDITNITFDYVTQSDANVTIILGKDYKRFKPFSQ